MPSSISKHRVMIFHQALSCYPFPSKSQFLNSLAFKWGVSELDWTLSLDYIGFFIEEYHFRAKMSEKCSEKCWHQQKIDARLAFLIEMESLQQSLDTNQVSAKTNYFFAFKSQYFQLTGLNGDILNTWSNMEWKELPYNKNWKSILNTPQPNLTRL